MKTHLAPTESLTVVIDDKEITVTALEALTYLNSEDKIAMFGCDKVKED